MNSLNETLYKNEVKYSKARLGDIIVIFFQDCTRSWGPFRIFVDVTIFNSSLMQHLRWNIFKTTNDDNRTKPSDKIWCFD